MVSGISNAFSGQILQLLGVSSRGLNNSIAALASGNRIKVGSQTYTTQIGNTMPGANTSVRFTSASGGFFDVTLAAGQGTDGGQSIRCEHAGQSPERRGGRL